MTTTSNGDDENRPPTVTFRLNPEALQEVPQLPGLDQVEVVYIQVVPTVGRWVEGLAIHIVGTAISATIAFTIGLVIGSNLGG